MAVIDLSGKISSAVLTKFSLYEYYASQSSFKYQDNVFYVTNGRTYEDVVTIGDDNGNNKLQIGGTGLTVDGAHNLTGGTITGLVEQHVVDPVYTKATFLDLNIPATSFWAAVKSTSNTDDLALLKSIMAGNDTVTMTHFGDVVQTQGGNDLVHGLEGNDSINGGTGNDTLYGDAGNDTLIGGTGTNTLDGGDGIDIASYTAVSAAVTVNLATGKATGTGIADTLVHIETVYGSAYADTMVGSSAADTLIGQAGDDSLTGGGGNDTLRGDDGNDRLFGLAGDDRLYGNAGADVMKGGVGNDTLLGGTGRDLLYGEQGKDTLTGNEDGDTFVFATGGSDASRTLADRITDFSHTEHDRINLVGIDANTGLAGDQAFTFIGSGKFTEAGQLHAIVGANVTWVEGDTNGDHLADFAIRLDGVMTLVVGDFVL